MDEEDIDLPASANQRTLPPEPLATALTPRRPANVNAATPERDTFRRSEAWLAGQIARAVARGQRVL